MSFVIPVYNALPFLSVSLPSVREAARVGGPAEIIVVDNGSTDGSWEWINRELADVAIIERYPGYTVGALRNAGSGRATGKLLAFIDADCVVPPDYIERAYRVLERTGAAGTGCRYDLPQESHWIERTWHALHERGKDGPAKYINSGNLVLSAAAFHAVGGFDETLITGEDAELGQRLSRAGYQLFESREVPSVHLGNPKAIGHFFRKQRWHALGMFGTVDLRSIDRPTVMTLLFLATVFLAGLLPTQLDWEPVWLVSLAIGLVLLVPMVTVIYRVLEGGRSPNPLGAVALYFLYYVARSAALVEIGVGRLRQLVSK